VSAEAAVAFARGVRDAGIEVPVDGSVALVRAWAAVDAGRQTDLYWAGRATLVHRPEDIAAYDTAFAAFFSLAPPEERREAEAETRSPGPTGQGSGGDQAGPGWSTVERLRHTDLAELSEAEREEAMRLIDRLALRQPHRRSRRVRPARRAGHHPDLRRTTRAALRTGGEPLSRRWVERTERPRPMVLLVDVSGSMAPYARALLRFAQVAVAGGTRVEAFVLGTRLTRVTRELSSRDPDAALAAAADAVADWHGGTRLGECLGRFNEEWGLARGATVVVLSDGWDRGDPDELGAQVARLHRLAHRLVWVNPLKARPGYEPLARGMAAALPHVDRFVEGHDVAAIEALVEVVAA
jgi:uncharacterized protein with von Willebrand factor type A (vWA) domain